MHPIVEELKSLIIQNNWQDAFDLAIKNARESRMPGLERFRDMDALLASLDRLATWAPRVEGDPRHTFDTPLQFYLILDQEPLKSLQSPVRPAGGAEALSPLSAWLVKFVQAYGAYLDTPESATCIDTFRPIVAWDEYMPPPSGYLTFNQFFARHVKPGLRPVASLGDDSALVSPADSTFVGSWSINESSEIEMKETELDLKGLKW